MSSMAETISTTEPVPSTPGIREVRPEMGTDAITRKVGLRAEIDTSPPFGSVKEAVTKFGGSGPWMPYYRLFGDGYVNGEIDIKKVEEQAAELEKDLIVKELETLDVLEELGTTKRVVEELKLQLQKEALRCIAISEEQQFMSRSPVVAMNKQNCGFQRGLKMSPSCPASSPDLILMELKQAKMNLGKTLNDLGVIQTSVDSLNKKMKKEKSFLQKTRQRLMSNFAGVLSLEEELKQVRSKPTSDDSEETKNNISLKTAELRLLAAKKMEEAARAAEAVALAEINFLSSSNSRSLSGYTLPEPDKATSFVPRSPLSQQPEGILKKKVLEVSRLSNHEYGMSMNKMSILKRLKEATEEVKQSKKALEDALNKVEQANRKQFAAEEALRGICTPEDYNNYHYNQPESPLLNEAIKETNVVDDENPKPVLRTTVSMRDVLSRKQVLAEEYVATTRQPMEGARTADQRQKVALSQMLHELREDITFHPRTNKEGGGGGGNDHHHHNGHFVTQRRKFGFIHISLPLTRQSKKKVQDLNNIMH